MQDFRNLAVWRRAHALALAVYRETKSFPRSELYGLTSQLRRGATSIPSNIAEGCGRRTDADFARFVVNALGSASEVEYHLLLAHDLALLSPQTHTALTHACVEIKRMLAALLRKLSSADS
jgi:four helix bundle protein